MQRLFSTFPNSWPGAGLLILRVAAAGAILVSGFGTPMAQLWGPVLQAIAGVTGALLLIGLWTPVAGLLQVVVQLSTGFGQHAGGINPFLLSALGLGLSLIGPGAWSLDARLFGRKRIDFTARKD